MKEKVVLFGASRLGEIAFRKLNKIYDICFFLDNDVNKHNRQFCGRDVKGSEILLNKNNIFKIIITSCYDVSIAKQLIEMDIKKFGVFDLELKEVKFYDYTKITSNGEKKISLIMNNNSGSNTLALYKKTPENISKKYDVVLINLNDKDESYYFNLSKSKMVVRTHYDNFFYDSSQINIQLWHGFPLKGLSYMNKYTNSIGKEKKHVQWNITKAIPSYSQTYSTLINACYGVKENKYEVTGMPRNDLMLQSRGRENLSRVLNIKIENKKIIFYMPTYRHSIYEEINGDIEEFNIINLDGFKSQEFDAYLEESDVIMVVKFHPLQVEEVLKTVEEQNLKNVFILKDKNLLEHDLDLYEVINSVDVLITDYSSIYFDYLLLDRPIIFTQLDIEKYKENRGFLLEPIDFWTPGPKCKNINELKLEINKSLEDANYYKREREIIRDIVHRYKDSYSSERVWRLLDKLMEDD